MQRLLQGLFILALLTSLWGCDSNFLTKAPPDQISDQNFWRNGEDATKFLNAAYRSLPDCGTGFTGTLHCMVFWETFSDNAYMGVNWHMSHQVSSGSFGPAHGYPNDVWERSYEGIRQANVLLDKIDEVEDIESSLRERLKGEARFVRAYLYHDLMRFYGGVPIVKKPQTLDSTNVARDSKEEVVSFLRNELSSAATMLPEEYGGNNVGRATEGAALALKSRVELYAEMWSEAASTAQEVMNLGVYELYPEYGALFKPENENNSEVIFAAQHIKDDFASGMDTWNQPNTFGWGGVNPLQSLIDAYEFTDGETMEESAVYDPENPYENRDPRFYASIVWDDSEFKNTVIDTSPGVAPDGIGTHRDATKTGYYMRKHLDVNTNATSPNFNSPTDWILIRYAEVLLNYAEAKNEASGPGPSVYEAINTIRARVDMPPLDQNLSQEEMRQRIRHERRIELAFEGHRYFDIRRWEIADEVMPGPVYGMEVDGEHVEVTERVWAPRLNLWPIPRSEIDLNPQLDQNPGW